MKKKDERPTKYERNPLGVANQCTASRGPRLGRCPNTSTHRYAQKRPADAGLHLVWMDRCADHPMSNHAGVMPITATREDECQPR
jgi:hypothetical protein